MPACFGHWNTAFVRYRLWYRQGVWLRIMAALGSSAPLWRRRLSADPDDDLSQ